MTHSYPIGTIVEVDLDWSQPGAEDGIEINLAGTCKLFVVGHSNDTDGNPQYILSDIPVRYPSNPRLEFDDPIRMTYKTHATVVEHGADEANLKLVGAGSLHDTIEDWLRFSS